jgi:hypothetical protein
LLPASSAITARSWRGRSCLPRERRGHFSGTLGRMQTESLFGFPLPLYL